MIGLDLPPPRPRLIIPPRDLILPSREIHRAPIEAMKGGLGVKTAGGKRRRASTKFQHWRYLETANAGSTYAILWEIEFSDDAAATWLTASSATASSTFGGFPASNAIDKNTGSRWTSADATKPAWHTSDLGSPKLITHVRITTYNTGGVDASPVSFSILASSSGAFSGEQVTKLSVSGLSSVANLTQLVYAVS